MKKYTQQYHDCLVELWQWHKSFRGPGVRNTHRGVTFSAPAARRSLPSDPGTAAPVIGLGQFTGMAYMNVTQNQMGSSYPFAHELV